VARLFFVAGESSGDTHGANLIRALLAADDGLVCEGLGGPRMAEAGMTLRYDLASHAIMGFVEVFKSLGLVRRLLKDSLMRFDEARPDCLVLIDYPGFNLHLAKKAAKRGIPIVYYISPQVWAWKKGRIHTLARLVRKMLVILPFEEQLYTDQGVDCTYVGHPLMDHIATLQIEGTHRGDCVIGLLPGSRAQEIDRILPVQLEVARGIREARPEARFVVPCVDEARAEQVQVLAGDFPLETAIGGMYEVLSGARFCLVASGTATVETAAFGVPFLLMYRLNPVTFWLARLLVDVQHIGMVNILAGRTIVPEFVQHQAKPEAILPKALELIDETTARRQMLKDLEGVRRQLGEGGASRRAAQEILEVVHG
jgi:lipid-A-disaccharide synthase